MKPQVTARIPTVPGFYWAKFAYKTDSFINDSGNREWTWESFETTEWQPVEIFFRNNKPMYVCIADEKDFNIEEDYIIMVDCSGPLTPPS